MKKILFTLIMLVAIGLVACRKSTAELDIKAYDQQQIQAYIATNGITGMQEAQDTTGIWYKIITPGKDITDTLGYTDQVSYVYTQKSFDNKYILADTVLDHFQGYVGHIAPKGLAMAFHNILKYNGGKMRVLIPSHLAYGVSGAGSGSSTVANGRIAGNQCLDYTINTITDQAAYDQVVIQNYMTANNLSGYTKTADGLWYKITTAPTGTTAMNINSSVTATYTGTLLNGTVFDNSSATTAATFTDLLGFTTGFREGLFILSKAGGSISLLVPSALAYGQPGQSAGGIPSNACLRFDVSVVTVTN
ncbi:MAG: FKBP-type peptidyl-prolyl cis-trans isomerase [Mucilaginibacter sp.]